MSALIQERYVVGRSTIQALEALFRFSDAGLVTGSNVLGTTEFQSSVFATIFRSYGFPEAVDGYGKTLASTVSGQALATLTENYNRTDAATIVGLATASFSSEIHGLNDIQTVIGTGIISSVQAAAFLNANTVTYTAVVTDVQQYIHTQAQTVTGVASISRINTHIYIPETPTFTATSVISYYVSTDYPPDSATVDGTAVISAVNNTESIAGGLPTGVSTASSVEIYSGVFTPLVIGTGIVGTSSSEDDVVIGTAVISGPDHYNFKDAATVTGSEVIILAEIPAIDNSLVIGSQFIRGTEIRSFADNSLIVGIAVPITSSDLPIHAEAGTINGQSVISAVDQANYLDAATTSGTGVEIGVFVFGGYDIGQYEVSLYDEPTGFDADAVTGVGTLSIVEVYP